MCTIALQFNSRLVHIDGKSSYNLYKILRHYATQFNICQRIWPLPERFQIHYLSSYSYLLIQFLYEDFAAMPKFKLVKYENTLGNGGRTFYSNEAFSRCALLWPLVALPRCGHFFPMKTSTDNDDDISFTHLSWGNLNFDFENNLSRKTLTWLKYGFRIHSTINWDPISLLRNPDLNRFQMQIRDRDAGLAMSNLLSDHRSWSRGALNCRLCIGPCLGMVMAPVSCQVRSGESVGGGQTGNCIMDVTQYSNTVTTHGHQMWRITALWSYSGHGIILLRVTNHPVVYLRSPNNLYQFQTRLQAPSATEPEVELNRWMSHWVKVLVHGKKQSTES